MLVHSFKNIKGNLMENIIADEFTMAVPGMPGFKQHGLKLVVKDEYAHGYSATCVSLVEGAYYVKELGLFDFDYWRLKYFHDGGENEEYYETYILKAFKKINSRGSLSY